MICDWYKHTQYNWLKTHQFDGVAGFLKRVHRHRVGYVNDWYIVNGQNGVVDFQTAIGRCRSSGYELRDVDGGVVADVRVVGAAGDAETQAGATPFEDDLFVFPFIVAVYL